MNFIKLFDSIKTDNKSEEEVDTYMSRKEAFRKMGGLAKKATLASLPVAAFTAIPNMAFAKNHDVVAVLKFALALERLEYQFYLMGQSSGVVAADDRDVFDAITRHEGIHVDLLEETINALGGDLEGVPSEFDYTAGGIFPDPFANYQIFLALSQGFEDTGVRAYKGQAPNLIDNDNLLQVALKIHSVEARHASQVRRLRDRKGWVTTEDYDGIEGFEAATAAIYQNEQNTTHLGVDVTKVAMILPEGVTEVAVEEAWDEPLSRQQVLDIVTPFIVR
jgi:rubrerythrin